MHPAHPCQAWSHSTLLLAAWLIVIAAPRGLAHDPTLPAHEAARDRVEARLIGRGIALTALAAALPTDAPVCQLTLRVRDADTQRPLPALVRVTRADGTAVPLAGLVNRATGLPPGHPGREWFTLLESGTVAVPREELRIECLAGLETERAAQTLDLRGREFAELTLEPARFSNCASLGWRAGNPHLHLRGLSRAQADEYLQTIPRADGLEMLFVSYARRTNQDGGYISNTYTPAEVRALSGAGVQLGWGEEHRNNFAGFGEGYGHVMLLNLRELVEPVSIGPGITGSGFDFPPLRRGMDEARRAGGTVLWCHNSFGFEDVPNWLTGRIHAHNIFDGGTRGGYADSYYRFLNVGLKVPFSTGTDWFIYDFSRVYARMNEELNETSWLAAVASGRTFITNGPLLELRADDHQIGDTIRLEGARSIPITARATGRVDFKMIELIYNGTVVAQAPSRPVGGHFEAELEITKLNADAPGWIALRVRSRSAGAAPALTPPAASARVGDDPVNELGEVIFAHTSPIYLEFAGRGVFLPGAARALMTDLETAVREITRQGHFESDAQRDEVLALYRESAAALRKKLGK